MFITNHNIIEYKGIKLMDAINTRPHSDSVVTDHDSEYNLFQEVLEKVKNKENPVMVEIGCWWAFWSLCFRKKFPKGKNILVELGKRQLSIGLNNFKLNEFSETHYWGGFFLNESTSFVKKQDNYDFPELPNEYYDTELLGSSTGPQIDFIDIYSLEKLSKIDLLHMDIQGSEMPLFLDLKKNYPFILENVIDNIVVATHSSQIHHDLQNLFQEFNYKLTRIEAYGSVGGDGMIIASKN